MGNSNRPRRLTALLVFGSGGLVTGASAATPSEPAAGANQLEEIVVTAQKREQSLNDVGFFKLVRPGRRLTGSRGRRARDKPEIGRAHV